MTQRYNRWRKRQTECRPSTSIVKTGRSDINDNITSALIIVVFSDGSRDVQMTVFVLATVTKMGPGERNQRISFPPHRKDIIER